MSIGVAFLLLVAVATQVRCDDGASMKAKLIADHKDYQKFVEPDNVHVQIGMNYLCAQYDPETHKLTSRVYERYTWNDTRLAWKPESYGGVDKLHFPADHIWTPDVRLFDAVGKSEERDDVNVVILSTGTVYWIVPAVYRTVCLPSHDKDKDDHSAHCNLKLGAWTYDSDTVPLDLFAGGFDTKYENKACPYEPTHPHVMIKTKKYDCCPKPYQTLEISFDLHEKDHEHDEEEEEVGDHKKSRWEKYLERNRPCSWPYC